MTIWWHPTGPKLSYDDGVLHVYDLNPEQHIRWRMTRWELVKVGFGCILAAIGSRSHQDAPGRPSRQKA
jgi:hypothetical protein